MIKKIAYFIFAVIITTSVFGQSETTEEDVYVLDGDDYVLPADSLKMKDKMHYSFEVGAGVGHSNTYGNYFSTYYKPTIRYDVSPRFSIHTGMMYVNSSVDKIPVISDNTYQLFSGNISQYYAFLGGEYKLSDRLTVGGSVFYDFTSYNTNTGSSFRQGNGLENIGYSAYVKYRVTKNLTFEAEIRINDRNPYRQHSSPFSNGFLGAGTSLFER